MNTLMEIMGVGIGYMFGSIMGMYIFHTIDCFHIVRCYKCDKIIYPWQSNTSRKLYEYYDCCKQCYYKLRE